MATKTLAQLKTGRDFSDVLDSMMNLTDGGAVTGNMSTAGTFAATGISTLTGGVHLGTEALTGAGACSISVPVTFLDTTGGAVAVTLAASTVAGAIKYIVMVKDGGDATLTIANTAGAANTVAFAAVGEAITLVNAADEDGTIIGWCLLSRETGAANATAAFDGPVTTAV